MTDERFKEIAAYVAHQKSLGIFNGKEAAYLDEFIQDRVTDSEDELWAVWQKKQATPSSTFTVGMCAKCGKSKPCAYVIHHDPCQCKHELEQPMREIIEQIMTRHWDMAACTCWVCVEGRKAGCRPRESHLRATESERKL